MDLLFANDTRGEYPQSWYAATAQPLAPHPPVQGAITADVCIIGGGFTGLSAALHLAQRGARVVLLEAHRIGFGASGRNGGQLGSGQRQDQQTLEKMLGRDTARLMWNLGEDAKNLVKTLVDTHDIDCALKPGIAWAGTSAASVAELHDYAEHMGRHYDYEIEAWDRAQMHAVCPSPEYLGGIYDHGGAHLHPLKLAFGLARAAVAAGATLYENSHVTRITEGKRPTVYTDQGSVTADSLILGCNGYLGGLNAKTAARVMPINNFIAATEPLGPRTAEVLTRDIAMSDDLFVINYFRLSEDNRLLFGGGESYGYRFPGDMAATVRKPMVKVFPQLRDIKIDYVWGGTLAITMNRVPHLARLAPNILTASGYSGHGVGNAVQAGKLMAEAALGPCADFDHYAALPVPKFPGGHLLRTPLLTLAMSWYAMRDKLGI